jgi:NifU-like protein
MDHIAEILVSDDSVTARIQAAIDEFRPALKADGGDCQLVSVEGNLVTVRMTGACMFCQYAQATISTLQERMILAVGKPLRIAVVR